MILRTSKSEIGRWELSEVEEQILFEDYRFGCRHKQDFENEEAPNIF